MQPVEYKCDSCMYQDSCGQLTKATARSNKCTKYVPGNTKVQHKTSSPSDELQHFYEKGVTQLETRIQTLLKGVSA